MHDLKIKGTLKGKQSSQREGNKQEQSTIIHVYENAVGKSVTCLPTKNR